jgi:CelD/BcsL family acetyltransferase involved in cellulose biosynthesis
MTETVFRSGEPTDRPRMTVFQLADKEFLASKSQKFRKNLKASRRKLEALGKLEFKTYLGSPHVEQQLERYQDLENRRRILFSADSA